MRQLLGKAAAAAAIASMAVAPALAAPTSAASALSLRASTASKHDSELMGAPVIALIGIAAIVAGGVIIATEDDNPDSN